MKKSLKVAIGGLGLTAAVAVPLAVVACGTTTIELTAEDKELLQTTKASTFGSNRIEAPLMDLIKGKTITVPISDGVDQEIKNYLIFIGTTACPVCNKLLTDKETREYYTKTPDINTYNGPFAKAVFSLQSNKKIQKTFIWEDLAPGYGDTNIPNGSNDNFPWSSFRSDDISAKTFKAVEKYYQISKYRSPLIIAVVNNSPKIVSGIGPSSTNQEIYDIIIKDYFVETLT